MPTAVAHKIGTYETGSPEWHAARDGKMSGSRIAAAAGISPWESPFSLWHRMAGNIGEVEQTEAMAWGTILEPVIIDQYAIRHPEVHVIRRPGTWLNNQLDWMLANPDGLIRFPGVHRRPVMGVLEAKTARYPDEWGPEGSDQIPVHYLAQVLWYLRVLGLRFCIVVALFGGNDFREYLVEADDSAADELVTIAREFMDSLAADTPPDLDGSAATFKVIKELHPEITLDTVDVPDEIAYNLLREQSRLIPPTERFNLAKAELARFMGTAKTAYWNGTKFADRRAKGSTGVPYVQLASNLRMPSVVPAALTEKVAS